MREASQEAGDDATVVSRFIFVYAKGKTERGFSEELTRSFGSVFGGFGCYGREGAVRTV